MFRNQLKIVFRSLLKQKLYSFINIFGLAIGIAFVLLIFLFVQHELSYDKFHENAQNIYLINEIQFTKPDVKEKDDWRAMLTNEEIYKSAYLPMPLGPTLKNDYPEVQQFSRYGDGNATVRFENKVFKEGLHFVDGNFLEMFSFPLLEGKADEVLAAKNQVVITPEIARKYFGRKNPIGQTLIIKVFEKEENFSVAGLVEAPPVHSSLSFNILIPIENKAFYEKNMERWGSFNTPTFIELADNVSTVDFKNKLQLFVQKYMSGTIDWIRERHKLGEKDRAFELTLTALGNVHLDASVGWRDAGNPLNILILSGIALLILIIACLNYISLALTGASGRTTEVGIRKVLGSTPNQLRRQFWLEAQALVLIALVIAIILTEIFLPTFNTLIQRELSTNWSQQFWLLLPLGGIALLTGLIAGGYPALFLARFQPIEVLRGHKTYRMQPSFIKSAVIAQFAMSAFLIISALIMYQQMQYVNQKDLGYDKEQVFILYTNTGWGDEGERLCERMKMALKNNSDISSISGTNLIFNSAWDMRGFDSLDNYYWAYVYRADYDYLSTLGINLIEGRNFSTENPSDITSGILINQAMVETMNLDDPIGANIPWIGEEEESRVIGIVENYHFRPLGEAINPMLLHINPKEGAIEHIMFKINGKNMPQIIETIRANWKAIAPYQPFEYTFLDETVAAQYESYNRWMSIISVATLFAIFIACLGLFGLAGIMAVNKTKEIGIRKVLGASTQSIMILLNKDLVKLAFISLLLAAPISYYAMTQWLDNFAFKIEMGWEIFVLAGLLCVGIALITVSYHSIKAAWSNPIDSLKVE